jgi:spore germination cell wall hydrolase CwlJ-like protein
MEITYKTILIQMIVFLVVTLILTAPTLAFARSELECLAKNLYFEARGESEAGQFAVGFVTMNRVRNKRWPDSVCKVVYQPGQFSWVKDAHSNEPRDTKLYHKMIYIASIVMQSKEVEYYGHYFNTTHSKAKSIVVVGNHRFY